MNNEQQDQGDLDVINALKEAGSNMSKPHRIEHHFFSKSKKSLEILRDYAIKKQYQVSDILSTGLIFKTFFFDIITDTVPTIENISPVSRSMNKYASAHSCTYDGWGCGVED